MTQADADQPAEGSPAERWDVFLSYRWSDRDVVERIAGQLRRAGVRPWLDRWEPAGVQSQAEVHAALARCGSAAVFVGPDHLGDWEQQEMQVALDRAARDVGFRVFPVLLPGVSNTSTPPFAAIPKHGSRDITHRRELGTRGNNFCNTHGAGIRRRKSGV